MCSLQIITKNNVYIFTWTVRKALTAPVGKNQTYRGKGGKFDFFHILMLHRLGCN